MTNIKVEDKIIKSISKNGWFSGVLLAGLQTALQYREDNYNIEDGYLVKDGEKIISLADITAITFTKDDEILIKSDTQEDIYL